MTEERHLVGLIGSGIGQSLSPALHEHEADQFGLRYLYQRLDLAELGLPVARTGELLAAARLAGYTGFNITHPCKQVVLEFLDGLSPEAADLGAVNTVVYTDGKAIGHNTDLSGFTRGIHRGLPDVPKDRVVLLGAGGAGAAVSQALLAMGTTKIWLFDKVPERAASLADRLGADRAVAVGPEGLADAVRDADGLVHATPTGMAAHPGTPLPRELLRPELWVADIVYRPLETELVIAARATGCRVLDGGMMAVFQAADSFRLFTGREPDADRMLRHFGTLVHTDEPGRYSPHVHR
ncbi:MAG: shikimate dehydrogenase [Kibdelosporangium sp.]